MRLQRALARAGVASRRAAEDLIRGQRVRVNGDVAHLGMSVDPDTDVVTVDGQRLAPAKNVWIALHKPIGYVVTRSDPEGRSTVFELVPGVPGLTYVGRLDVMTTGLLLLTTDGGAAHRLMHPRFEVERTYRAVVHGRSEMDLRSAFDRGIVVDDRRVNVVSAKIRPSEESRGSLELLLVLAEGRYRIVRRLCEQLGLKVERLARLSYGPIRLGDMAPGTWRYLTKAEVMAIDRGDTQDRGVSVPKPEKGARGRKPARPAPRRGRGSPAKKTSGPKAKRSPGAKPGRRIHRRSRDGDS